MKQIQKLFYRENGIRFPNDILSTPSFSLTTFPRNALYHRFDGNEAESEVNPNLNIFQGYVKKIELHYVTELSNTAGSRHTSFNLKEASRIFRQKNNKKFNVLYDNKVISQDPDILVVYNYGYLDELYKYQSTPLSHYLQWANLYRELWGKVATIAEQSDRNQYVVIKISNNLQGMNILNNFIDEVNGDKIARIFGRGGDEGFMQLDIWRWLSVENRDKSLISAIKTEHLSKVNLVIKSDTGKSVLINLGYLNSWIKDQPNQTDISSIVQNNPVFIQKLFLKLCMILTSITSEEEEVVPEEQPEVASQKDPDVQEIEAQIDNNDEDSELNISEQGLSKKMSAYGKPQPALAEQKDEIHKTSLTNDLLLEIEKDIEALDNLSKKRLQASEIKTDAEVPQKPTISREEVIERVFTAKTPDAVLQEKLAREAEYNLLTAADYRKLTQMSQNYQESEDPYGSSLKRKDAMVIKKEDLVLTDEASSIPVTDAVVDKTMAESRLVSIDKQYLEKVLKKDILQTLDAVQAAGVVIKRHEIDEDHSVLGAYEKHTLEIKPVDGQPSTISFTFPKVDSDGSMLVSGSKYVMRRQRVDLPIRKIEPRIVALSTYYGKTFVQTNPAVSKDSLVWLCRKINLSSLSGSGPVTDVNPGNVFNSYFEAPFIFNALSHNYDSFKVGQLKFVFDRKKIEASVDPKLLQSLEKDRRRYCGSGPSGSSIVVDKDDNFILISNGSEKLLGNPAETFGFGSEQVKAPVDFAEVRIYSKYVPVGVVLGYYIGFSNLLKLLNIEYREVEPRKQKGLGLDEYALVFKDKTLVFKKTNKVATLIISGFDQFEKTIKGFALEEFDRKDVYFNLLMAKGMAAVYIRELDMMETCFVDPISKEILLDMKEPQTFMGLLIRSCELLTSYSNPISQDRAVMRDRGYERFAGVLYKEMMTAIKAFKNKNMVGRSKIDMSPYQVWNTIMKDNSLKIVEDINPIQNLKESEVFTYSGLGGRDKDTMTKPTRAISDNDFGLSSESTVDSTSVGTIAYLSANPNLSDVRGRMSEEKKINPTTCFSTSALLSPCAAHDVVKRIMFITTQQSHTIASGIYRQPYLRTGYESVIGKRTSKMFSFAAEEDGVIESLTQKGLVIAYSSGKKTGVALGRVYGKAEGTTYPHDIVTPYKQGDKVKRGDIIAYNTKFFEPDFIDPKNIIMKASGVARVAFKEGNSEHEDSNSLSKSFGERASTEVVKNKSYIVSFKQNLIDVKKIGEAVLPKDILMIIEDEITAVGGQFSNDALSTLRKLSNMAPKAGVRGIVERIEVYYHGDKRDMSASLKKLADRSDSEFAAQAKDTGAPVVTGRVTEEHRVKGTSLELDQAEIRFYIAIKGTTGVGDKVVFGHQMKSTVALVNQSKIYAEDGNEIDATFSYASIARRGALSPALVGTTISLLDFIGKKAAEMRFNT